MSTVQEFLPPKRLECCSVDLAHQIVTITIDRPEVHNALHPPACAELGSVLDACESSPDVRVVVVTGAGERTFCAGFDLQYAETHPQLYQDATFGSELVRRRAHRKPLVAAVNGAALGFGFELALACDLIVAGENARFGLPEPRVGLTAMAGGIARLMRDIGPKRALALVLTGRTVTAREGQALGFVNEVCAGSPVPAAKGLAEAILRGAPLSIAASLSVAYRSLDIPDLATALDPESYPLLAGLLSSEDAQEGRRAFLEKREPKWSGR